LDLTKLAACCCIQNNREPPGSAHARKSPMTDETINRQVRTERRDRSLWIWIDREERRNAINKAVIQGIEAAITEARHDAELRSVVLTGVGRKAFCAGADLTGGAETFTLGLNEPMTDFGKLARLVRDLGVPVIGRINGDCVAGGMGLMALCDLIVVADHARFGLPEAKVGVFPMQVLVFLRSMIGARHINELCLTGELIGAARAREIGIANYVVSFEELDSRVDSLLERLGEMSPVALRRGKYAIAAMEKMAFGEALAFAETLIAVTALTGDATEGLAAFNDRRPPRWKQNV
jgi:enoyl-CoA hydratase/carnithine racemase